MPTKWRSMYDVVPGDSFEMLTVIEFIPGTRTDRPKFRCRCRCGGESTPNADNFVRGGVKSCGCLKRTAGARNAKARVQPGRGYGRIIPEAKFDRLTVIQRLPDKDGRAQVACVCSCGTQLIVNADGLIQNGVRSCGCLKSDTTAARNRRDARYGGFTSEDPLTWVAWAAMMSRCYRPSQRAYPFYGAKGVRVCHWLRQTPRNLKELIGGKPTKRHTLDRFPIHDGNYTCGQCDECKANGWAPNIRWATRKEQSLNRGDFNVRLTAFGKTLTRSEWQDLSDINEWRIHRRIHELGWTVEKALTTPDKKGNCYKPEGVSG